MENRLPRGAPACPRRFTPGAATGRRVTESETRSDKVPITPKKGTAAGFRDLLASGVDGAGRPGEHRLRITVGVVSRRRVPASMARRVSVDAGLVALVLPESGVTAGHIPVPACRWCCPARSFCFLVHRRSVGGGMRSGRHRRLSTYTPRLFAVKSARPTIDAVLLFSPRTNSI